ncbi:MAG: hypothetical protein JXB13_11945 [Phycisphaerae bacterium]|nr:hypothetical protein [Phycisphaerae bacterium]
MSSKDFAIGVLCTTGTILLVGLLILHSQTQPAMAAGVGVQAGDYVMAVGKVDDRTDVLYVIDTGVNGMNSYYFDFKSGALIVPPGGQQDLGRLRTMALSTPGSAAPGRRP